MKRISTSWALIMMVATMAGAADRPNVLFIAADDLNMSLGCYGNAVVKTPHLDALAARGMRFTRAYCQYPACATSRAALMSGMYPRAIPITKDYTADELTKALGDRPTMAGLFKRSGWHTARVGKIYHLRVPADIIEGEHGEDHEASWSERYSFKAPEWMTEGEFEDPGNEGPESRERDPREFGIIFYAVRGTGDGAEQCDVQAADKAIELIGRMKDQPFFLAVGFVRPHVPLVAPAPFFEPYPAAEMKLPRTTSDDRDDIPERGLSLTSEDFRLTTQAKKKRVLAAYYASVAFMDAQVARVLAALDENGLRDDTIVVFTSDHGYHLGEHDLWQKESLHEESVRIPLILSGPGTLRADTAALAEQIDIYPTLAELCGLEIPAHVQGKSLKPVLADPDAEVHAEVYCARATGHVLRTARWSYISWTDGSEELYDMQQDPEQFTNLARDPAHAEALAEMKQRLSTKWFSIGVVRLRYLAQYRVPLLVCGSLTILLGAFLLVRRRLA